MIAVDTTLLVYAHRPECPSHERALAVVERLCGGRSAWGIPSHCLVEFAAIVSNRRIWKKPSTWSQIVAQIGVWEDSPSCRFLGEDQSVWQHCLDLARRAACDGDGWYDARIAGICLAHGVSTLWTADRDYSRFPALRTHDPLQERTD